MMEFFCCLYSMLSSNLEGAVGNRRDTPGKEHFPLISLVSLQVDYEFNPHLNHGSSCDKLSDYNHNCQASATEKRSPCN